MNVNDATGTLTKTIAALEPWGGAGALPGAGRPWIDALRRRAATEFSAAGLPTPRLEEWKYTNLRSLARHRFGVPDAAAPVAIDRLPSLLPTTGGPRAIFVQGRFRPELSRTEGLPEGVRFGSLAQAIDADDALEEHLGRIGADGRPMLALNAALMADGFVLQVPRNVVVETPIELIFIGGLDLAAAAWHPRNLILLGENASATLVEHHVGIGGGVYFVNMATEIALDRAASLLHHRLQAEGTEAFHIATLAATLGRDASYESFTLALGARVSRQEATVALAGEGATCRLNGAYLMRGEQHCDFTSVIEHQVPQTTSSEVFKGVLDDKARAVFQGRIEVRPKAQKSDGRQLNKTLLLSDRAEIDSKPELKIYADDVKCSHGSSAGAIDQDHLFYLRSRGLPETAARALLVSAFLAETLEGLRPAALGEAFEARIGDWLGDGKGGR